ncbi:MAG: EamA family transporter [Dehalococcoidia bacterium]|nr:EamA family transporter [Dehalococcoidia bacterium]
MKPLPLAVFVTSGALVGSSFLMIKVLVEDLNPTLVVAARLFLGALVALVVVRALGLPMLKARASYVVVFLVGSLGLALPYVAVAWGTTRVSSGSTAVLNASMPIVTACLAVWLLPDERLTPSKVTGLVAGFIGVAFLSGGHFVDLGSRALVGDLALIGAVLCFSIAAVCLRRFVRDENALTVAAFILLFAALVSAPIALLTEPPARLSILDEAQWVALITLGVATGLTSLMFYWLIARIGAMKASMNAYLMPATGVLLG